MNNYINCIERQLGSGQDFITFRRQITDKNGNKFDGLFMADGHGRSQIINVIKDIGNSSLLDKILYEDNPMNELQKCMTRIYCGNSSGATAIIIKIYDTHGLLWVVGDSRVAIIYNNEMVYISTPHNSLHPGEMKRLDTKITIKDAHMVPTILSKSSLIAKIGVY